MNKIATLFALVAIAVLYGLAGVFWNCMGRYIALSMGLIEPIAYDSCARGWKAERDGRLSDAFAAYHEAMRLDPTDGDASTRLAVFLKRNPEFKADVPTGELEPRLPAN